MKVRKRKRRTGFGSRQEAERRDSRQILVPEFGVTGAEEEKLAPASFLFKDVKLNSLS